MLLLAMPAACLEQPSPAGSPPASSAPTSTTAGLDVKTWFALGPYGVGNLGCMDNGLAWTTGTQPISKQNVRNDIIELGAATSLQPRAVASARHGGTLTDALPSSGSWLVYLEYQQQGESTNASFWYLNAVDVTSGSTVVLAQATSGVQLTELPWYDARDGHAVWNQLDANAHEVLHVYDFANRQATTVSLTADMVPFEPTISGSSVVFVDNATDPDRAHEDFLGRRGSLRKYDLLTKSVTTLSIDPTAFSPHASNGTVVWTATRLGTSVVASVPLAGGRVAIIGGARPITPQTNGSIIVWYDSGAQHFIAFDVKTARIAQLQVGTWNDVRSVFALCNTRLFFALPPASDGGTSSIRYVDLTPTA
jgi:hypothetical protein